MNPDELGLKNINKMFEYELISRELDDCTNIELLRNICKCYVKLYLKQQETLIEINTSFPKI
jgi:hypothetical protein